MIEVSSRISVEVLAPVTSNDRVELWGGAIIIKNAGDANITLDDGWTLTPGESIELGSREDTNVVWWVVRVAFAAGANPRCEFITMTLSVPGS
jgi:hypothetical protein